MGATRNATSTAVTKRNASSGGLFSWLTGESSSSLPPLDKPLGGVVHPPPMPDYVEPGKTEVTTLPNGFRIASQTSPQTSPVCACLYTFLYFDMFNGL